MRPVSTQLPLASFGLRGAGLSRRERSIIIKLSPASGLNRDHLPLLATLDQRAEVTVPRRHRVLYRARILGFVVNAEDATLVAGLMIQNLFHHMRLNADVAHARGDRPSQIVQRPRLDLVAKPSIERPLVFRP